MPLGILDSAGKFRDADAQKRFTQEVDKST
jgi:hypothetical protein